MSYPNTFFTKNTIFGIGVGLSFILSSFLLYKTGKSVIFNPQASNISLLLSIAGAYIGTRTLREEILHGFISFRQALGSSIYIIIVGTFIHAIFIFQLYNAVPELMENYKSMLDIVLEEAYKGQDILATIKTVMGNAVSPLLIAITDFTNKIFTGFIFSLLIAAMLKRKKYNL